MATVTGVKTVVSDDLVMALDFSNPRGYTGSASTSASNSNIIDMSRKSRQVTANGGVYVNSDKSVYFDGVDDFLYDALADIKYDRTQGHCTEAWFRFPTDASPNWHGLFGRGVGDGGYFMIHSGVSAIYHTVSGGSGLLKYSSGITSGMLFDENWHHLAWRYDPSDETSSLFHNGVRVVSHDMQNFLDITNASGGLRYIGAGAGRYGEHDMGIFRHYSRALTDEEVYQNYVATRGRYQP